MRHSRVILTSVFLALCWSVLARAGQPEPMTTADAENVRYNGTVAIWYSGHFEDSVAHDWVPIKEWNGPYRPLLGEYQTGDRAVVRKHLQWMRRAGVDVIVYDVVRVQPELTILELAKQKTLQLLIDELSHQEQEARKLKLAIWLEKWNTNPTPKQYRFGLEYVRKNLADRDFYYHLHGKPLLIRYPNGEAPALDAIEREPENQSFFTLRRMGREWSYLGLSGNQECTTVSPGADAYLETAFITQCVNHGEVDVEALRRHGKEVVRQRDDGRLFERQLLQARQANPELIFISGWNDWCYCLQIEPAVEYGFTYVDTAARLLGREAETARYRQAE